MALENSFDLQSYISISEGSRDHIKRVKEEIVSSKPLEEFIAAKKVCGEILRPLYKHQGKKEYHIEVTVSFERSLPGPSEYCHISQMVTPKCRRSRIERGQTLEDCLWLHQKCLSNKVIKVKLLSDLYKDECGNVLRGFSWIDYKVPGEDIMDSVSPGHTLELVEMFSFGGQYEAGETYPVHISSFVFFAAP